MTNFYDSQLELPLDPVAHARVSDAATSHVAAEMLTDKRTMLRALLATYREGSRTADEAAEAAGYGPADGAWKRISDLKNMGLIKPTELTRLGKSGRPQTVCIITAKGLSELR